MDFCRIATKVRESSQICKGCIRFFCNIFTDRTSSGFCFPLYVVWGVLSLCCWRCQMRLKRCCHRGRIPRQCVMCFQGIKIGVPDVGQPMSGTSILRVFLRVLFDGHLRGCLSLSFCSVHSIRPHFISSPCLSYCLRLPTGGAVRVIFTTAVRSKLRLTASSNASIW